MVQVERIPDDQDPPIEGSHILLERHRDTRRHTETTVIMSGQVAHSAFGATVITPQPVGAELEPALKLAEQFAERLYIPIIYVRNELDGSATRDGLRE